MAIRYSGDVEARMSYEGKRRYVVVVRWPGKRVSGKILFKASRKPTSSETYDAVAKKVIGEVRACHRFADRGPFGGVRIRRLFQAPCPVRGKTQGRWS